MEPRKLGPYLLEEVLGRGGMGTVYRGIAPETGEQVAIKILAPDLSDDPSFLERFQEEVQTLLRLKHPNIVQLLSFGKQEDVFYFAMELVEGKSLYAMQKTGHRFSYSDVIEIGLRVCEALQHSHNLGVIHRDLKPGNIIMSRTGEIKLADYGIAKRFDGQQMTMSGVLGTAEFMAPEQAQGKPATIQSDLYSLGAVLFALATGKPPIEGATPQKTLEKVVKTRAPSLQSIAKDVPPELDGLVNRLLKKQPENRPKSARSVGAKLSEILELLHERAEMETNLVVVDDPKSHPGGPSVAQPTIVEGASVGEKNSKKPVATVPTGKSVKAKATVATGEGGESKSGKKSRGNETLREESQSLTLAPAHRVLREQDFFERAVYTGEEETNESGSHWVTLLLAVGLVIVVAASGYLVYDRVIRDRTADELWVSIEASQERPMGVGREMEDFLRLYPEDPRADQVQELQAKSKAMQFRNSLALRASLNRGDLNEMERQFLKLTADDNESKWDKEVALQALITYYKASPTELAPETLACLEAAEVFRRLFRKQAVPEVEAKWQEILSRIEAADRLQAEDPTQAEQIRQSLIELFGDKKWAEPLIEPLRKSNDR